MDENLIKKTVNATYKVLDFFPDGDPLKNKAKERTLSVLENLTLISNANGWASFKKEKASIQLSEDLEVLKSYLELGRYQGWISHINFLILAGEYGKIIDMLGPANKIIAKSIDIIPVNEKKQLKEPPMSRSLTSGDGFSERQEKILKFLSERKKVQVSDIVKEIPNVTKRTIRRDLDDLLKRGKIIRVGEWNQVFYTGNK